MTTEKNTPREPEVPPSGLLVFLDEDGEVQYAAVEGGIQPAYAVPTILRKAASKIEDQLLK